MPKKNDAEKLAEEHAEWCVNFFRWVYKEAFKHGFGHGKENVIKELKK